MYLYVFLPFLDDKLIEYSLSIYHVQGIVLKEGLPLVVHDQITLRVFLLPPLSENFYSSPKKQLFISSLKSSLNATIRH